MEVSRFTLANGLRVVHNRDVSTAMVAVDVLYDVGARDESPEMTGLAHLFEHLMFGGSVNVPDFDGELQKAGGMSNAWTSNDFTNFYDVLPAHNVETAFWLESDRMLSLAFSERTLEVQRSVVIEEFKQQCLNRPYGDMDHHLRGLAYKVHPYRYPVIGKDFSHIERVTLDDVRDFFSSHYAPNNAVLSVSGNVDADTVVRLSEKWFGEIPYREVAKRDYSREPEQTAARELEVGGKVPLAAIAMAYPMEGYGTKQYVTADLLTDLLANGASSRFYRRLTMSGGLFAEADASIIGSEEPGLLLLNFKLHQSDDRSIAEAIEMVEREIEAIKHEPAAQRELTRAVNRMESAAMFANLNYLSKAQTMAMAEYHGEDVSRQIERYRELTPADIRKAAEEIFAPSRRSTLIYRPQ